jgi:hypothetical protein
VYALDEVYGPRAYHAFQKDGAFKNGLKTERQPSLDLFDHDPLIATSYAELVDIVSFLSVMNKRHSLYFRGQSNHRPPIPTIFRPIWRSLSGKQHEISNDPVLRQRIYDCLNGRISKIVLSVCLEFPMPRMNTLKMFREAVWAVAQHYELWPTPVLDITPNLRAAASFGLPDGQSEGNLYIAAMPPSTNSITFEADQHIVLARLQAVCPPIAKRPHYQDGFLVGRFPFSGPNPNQIDTDPSKFSNLSRRLVARIVLKDQRSADNSSLGRSFWSDDFPRMSTTSLMPVQAEDELLRRFMPHANEIDKLMHDICTN